MVTQFVVCSSGWVPEVNCYNDTAERGKCIKIVSTLMSYSIATIQSIGEG